MISTSEVVEKLIKNSPIIEEALSADLINYSSLARRLKPEIEKALLKNVKEGAIVMALKRLSKKRDTGFSKIDILKSLGDITIRSNLIDLTFANSQSLVAAQEELIKSTLQKNDVFLTISHGVGEVTIIASAQIEKEIKEIFQKEKIISQFGNLSSVTIKFQKDPSFIPGTYYGILKLLAWDGINVVEVVSTYSELTIVLDKKDIDYAFSLLKNIAQ